MAVKPMFITRPSRVCEGPALVWGSHQHSTERGPDLKTALGRGPN